MSMTALLCALFFAGYLALRTHLQAIAFLAIGAGLQLMSTAIPSPDGTTPDTTTTLLVCLFSALGYGAWRHSRRFLPEGLISKHRLGIFAGWLLNGAIATLILWQTGQIAL